jgi:aminoglycoside phosphotransferase (APT) family kinase protein
MTRPLDHLPDGIALALLERIAPGSELVRVDLLPGSFSNHTHVVEACLPDGHTLKCVVRRYQIYGNYDRGEKAQREYKAFELINRSGIPSPEPLLLDDTGEILGVPGIVECFVEGRLMLEIPDDPFEWARKTAILLKRIHSISLTEADRSFLLDGDREAVWFLYIPGDRPPDYMCAFPGGEDLWELIRELRPLCRPVPPVLKHGDYWEGNILWNEGEITAVLDWEEAAYGDPANDVAYALMNLVLRGLPEAAEEFLKVYEAEHHQKLENLAMWELAASVRPMVDPVDWQIDREPGRGRLLEFIANAKGKADAAETDNCRVRP